MAEESNVVDAAAEPQVVDAPAGESQSAGGSRTMTLEEVDAYTKARIDKQNSKHAKETEELTKRLADSDAEREEAQKRIAELEHEKNLHEWADEASREYGVPASVLRGESLEEMKEHASLIKESMPVYPTLEGDKGEPPTQSITKEEIYQIKNTEERIAAMGAHPEVFK